MMHIQIQSCNAALKVSCRVGVGLCMDLPGYKINMLRFPEEPYEVIPQTSPHKSSV